MSPRVHRWLEKVQVQVAVVAALAVGWFAVWRLVRPWHVRASLAFFPSGDVAALAVFAAMFWAMAAGCALLTLSARPEGALLATLAGAAGVALRGGTMRNLLEYSDRSFGSTFALLSVEVLALGGILIGAAAVIAVIRAVARRAAPGWVWSPPPVKAPPGRTADPPAPKDASMSLVNFAGCLVMELAVAVILLALTFRSPERGQVAFALAASFLLAAMAAHQMFPVRRAVPFWLGPLVMGAAVLALGAFNTAGQGPAWYDAIHVARGMPLRAASPLQWLGLGCGGAVAGFWISRRLRDRSHEEEQKKARS